MISSDILRGYNDIIVLGLLSEKDSYGYNLLQEITARSGHTYQMKETTLYSVLSRLEKNGMVRSYEGSETMGRKRTYFHITKEGFQFFQEKCQEWVETKELIDRFALRPALSPPSEPAITGLDQLKTTESLRSDTRKETHYE